MIEESKAKYDLAKEQLIQDIINLDLTEYGKLELIDRYNLYNIELYIHDPFSEEYNNYLTALNGAKVLSDNFFTNHDIQRHSIVKPYDYLNYTDNDDEMITIYTNRNNNIVHNITFSRFKELIIRWYHKNKAIGFTWEW